MNSIKEIRKGECEFFYRLGRTLGQGTFAVVKLATDREDGKKVAVKIMKKSAMSTTAYKNLSAEIEILQRLDHPNIVSLYEVIEGKDNICFIMEVMTGGELFDRILEKDKYTEKEAKHVIHQILLAVQYCHSLDIVHRDIKPENLLYLSPMEDSPVKLADFGLATLLKPNDMLHVICGTPAYVAPEIINGNTTGYGKGVDIWSVGVITYVLLSGCPPFYDDSMSELFIQITHAKYVFPEVVFKDISVEAKDFISRLLEIDTTKRLTATNALSHPWLTNAKLSDTKVLSEAKTNLKEFNAKRRLKGAIHAIQATRFFSSGSGSGSSSNSKESSPKNATENVIESTEFEQKNKASETELSKLLDDPVPVYNRFKRNPPSGELLTLSTNISSNINQISSSKNDNDMNTITPNSIGATTTSSKSENSTTSMSSTMGIGLRTFPRTPNSPDLYSPNTPDMQSYPFPMSASARYHRPYPYVSVSSSHDSIGQMFSYHQSSTQTTTPMPSSMYVSTSVSMSTSVLPSSFLLSSSSSLTTNLKPYVAIPKPDENVPTPKQIPSEVLLRRNVFHDDSDNSDSNYRIDDCNSNNNNDNNNNNDDKSTEEIERGSKVVESFHENVKTLSQPMVESMVESNQSTQSITSTLLLESNLSNETHSIPRKSQHTSFNRSYIPINPLDDIPTAAVAIDSIQTVGSITSTESTGSLGSYSVMNPIRISPRGLVMRSELSFSPEKHMADRANIYDDEEEAEVEDEEKLGHKTMENKIDHDVVKLEES